MFPFYDQLEIGDLFLGADDSNGFTGAFYQIAFERPRVIGTIDVHKVILCHGTPASLGAGDQCSDYWLVRLGIGEQLRLAKCKRGQQGKGVYVCEFHFG